jgi:hypothetical protein
LTLNHAKAMPLLLATPEEGDIWPTSSDKDVIALQRPLANDALHIVVTGAQSDRAPTIE